MKNLVKRLLTAGLITTMLITPAGSFAATTDTVPEAPEMPVAESYEDNELIEDYNAKVDEYNASAEAYNKAVDEEYDTAVKETAQKNEEIAAHNEAEEKRVSEAKARNEQAVKDADDRNRQIDEENAAGRKAAEEARDAEYDSDVEKYNADIEKYKADVAQYEADLAMEQRIKNAGYESVQQYNDKINSYYNDPADKSVEKNASAPQLSTPDTYRIEEAAEKSGRMIKVTIEHNFYDTDISYKEEFEIDANDIITFKPLSAPAENTNPGYATFYYNTDEAHSMGYWMESDSYVGTNAKYNEYGWECGDTHTVSFRDGTVRANDIEDIEVVYNYAWMPLKKYKTYNIPNEPTAPSEPVKKEINFEDTPYVEAELEEIEEANILEFIAEPVKKAYLDLLKYMDLFEVPQITPEEPEEPETAGTPETVEAPETPDTVETPEALNTPDSIDEPQTLNVPQIQDAPKAQGTTESTSIFSFIPFAARIIAQTATPAAVSEMIANTQAGNENAESFEDGAAPLAVSQKPAEIEIINDGQSAKEAPNGAWALVNLIAAVITVLIAAITAILGLKKKEEDEDDEHEADKTSRRPFVRALGVFAAIVSVIAFILTEDVSLPIQLTDQWTLMMIIILAVEAVLAIASKKTTREGEEKQEEENLAKTKLA